MDQVPQQQLPPSKFSFMFLLWVVGAIEIPASMVWLAMAAFLGLNFWMLLAAAVVLLGTVIGSLVAMVVALRRPRRKGLGHAIAGLVASSIALLLFAAMAVILNAGMREIQSKLNSDAREETDPAARRANESLRELADRLDKSRTGYDADRDGAPSPPHDPTPLETAPIECNPLEETPHAAVQWQKLDDAWMMQTKAGTLRSPLFSKDGQWLYAIGGERGGVTLVKIHLPEFSVNSRIVIPDANAGSSFEGLGTWTGELQFCSEGLALKIDHPSQLVVIDPETFSPKKCYVLDRRASSRAMAASPASSLIAVGMDWRIGLVNVETGTLVDLWPPDSSPRSRLAGLAYNGSIAMSEDGKQVFAGHCEGMLCFEIENERLVLKRETRHKSVRGTRRVWLEQPDRVVMQAEPRDYSYNVKDLVEKPTKVDRDEFRMFDRQTGNRTTHKEGMLTINRTEGRPLRAPLESSPHGRLGQSIVRHPDGRHFLASSGRKSFWIEFPKETTGRGESSIVGRDSATTPAVPVRFSTPDWPVEVFENKTLTLDWRKPGDRFTGIVDASRYERPIAAYSEDGKYLYIVESDQQIGFLEEIRLSDFAITRRLKIPHSASAVLTCPQGIVLYGSPFGLAVVDPGSLKVKRVYSLSSLTKSQYAQGKGWALAQDISKVFVSGTYEGKELFRILDLKTATAASHYNPKITRGRGRDWPDRYQFARVEASSDGKHLCVIHSYGDGRVPHIVFDEEGDSSLANPPSNPRMVPRGLTIPRRGGVLGIVRKKDCEVFDLNDMRQPLFVVPSGTALAYDEAKETLLVGRGDGLVEAFDRTGKSLHKIPKHADALGGVGRIQTSPADDQLAVNYARHLCLILPRGSKPPESTMAAEEDPDEKDATVEADFTVPEPKSSANPWLKKEPIAIQEATDETPGVRVHEVYDAKARQIMHAEWSADGNHLFLFCMENRLRRLSFPDFKKLDVFYLPGDARVKSPRLLARIPQGMLVSPRGVKTAALLDASSLEVKQFCRRGPFLTDVDAHGGPFLLNGFRQLRGMDPISGKVVHSIPSQGSVVVSPDGKHAYFGSKSIAKQAVTAKGFVAEASTGDLPLQHTQLLTVSSDGKLLAVLEKGTTDESVGDEIKKKHFTRLALYDAQTLARKKTVMPLEQVTKVKAVDAQRQLILVMERGPTDTYYADLYNFDGKRVFRHELDGRPAIGKLDPKNRGFIATVSGELFWFEFTD